MRQPGFKDAKTPAILTFMRKNPMHSANPGQLTRVIPLPLAACEPHDECLRSAPGRRNSCINDGPDWRSTATGATLDRELPKSIPTTDAAATTNRGDTPLDTHKTRFPLGLILVLTGLLAVSGRVESQCMVATTGMNTFPNPTTPTLIIVTKTLSAPYACRTTMMNASFCFPSAVTATTSQLVASALAVTANPSCAWSCMGCAGSAPHVTIDVSDGLPVELLDFSVGDDES